MKKFTELLKRSEGLSILAIIVVMVVMAVMGGVFSQIMGRWKLSAPAIINSSKALCLAETSVMFALRDAGYTFYAGNFNYGTSGSPYTVFSSSTEEANYWFERPDSGFENDDATGGTYDDDVDDDADDANTDLYTIIATGKVQRDSTTVAARQIKVKTAITKSSTDKVEPGVHTDGDIEGNGPDNNPHFDITKGSLNTSFANGSDNNIENPDPETGIVYRTTPTLEENMFKAMAKSQGSDHYHSGNYSPSDDDPNGSFYFDKNESTPSVPNVIYVGGDITANGNLTFYGVYWVKGNVTLNGNAAVHGIIICEGDSIVLNGGAGEEIVGGVIHYDNDSDGATLEGNGNNVVIEINTDYFEAMSASIPIVTVQSWQETISAN